MVECSAGKAVATDGARLAIRLLQDAAERGEIDPWDVDVIAVVDGFLDQLRQQTSVYTLLLFPLQSLHSQDRLS